MAAADQIEPEHRPDQRPPHVADQMETLKRALIENNRAAVESLLDNDQVLNAFRKDDLIYLYERVPKHKEFIRGLLEEAKEDPSQKPDSLKHVGRVLQQLMGDYYKPRHLKDDFQCSGKADAVREMFLWAVLVNRFNISKVLWKKTDEPMVAALVASQLLNAQREREARQGKEFENILNYKQECAELFTDRAVDVLNECFHKNKKAARWMVTREYPMWGESSCEIIALKSRNRKFISQPACQDMMNRVWKRNIAEETSNVKIFFSIFLVPLICHCIPSKGDKKDELPAQERVGDAADCRQKFLDFYRSPVVIFMGNTMWYLVFLGLYSGLLLVQLSPDFQWWEPVLAFWGLTIFLAECLQWVSVENYSAGSVWGKVPDVTAFVLFVVGAVLRGVVSHCPACYPWGRVFLALALLVYFFRLLRLFCINPTLGPKVFMIWKMLEDLWFFLLILLVFVVPYAIASEAILYPNKASSWKLLYYVPRRAYWHIFGELFLDEIEGYDLGKQCGSHSALGTNSTAYINYTNKNFQTDMNYTNMNFENTDHTDYGQPGCPSPLGQWVVPVLLGVYMLITNVLLLNLLIAIFSSRYDEVYEDTKEHGHFLMFQLRMDYSTRPALPPPFILISWIITCCCSVKSLISQTPGCSCKKKKLKYVLARTDPNEEGTRLERKKTDDLIANRYDRADCHIKDVLNRLAETQTAVQRIENSQREMQITLQKLCDRLNNGGEARD